MSDKTKMVHRKPLWLLIPAGQRVIETSEGEQTETLYTVEKFATGTDLKKGLNAKELDASNSKGVMVFRADAIPVESETRSQIVIKFGKGREG